MNSGHLVRFASGASQAIDPLLCVDMLVIGFAKCATAVAFEHSNFTGLFNVIIDETAPAVAGRESDVSGAPPRAIFRHPNFGQTKCWVCNVLKERYQQIDRIPTRMTDALSCPCLTTVSLP